MNTLNSRKGGSTGIATRLPLDQLRHRRRVAMWLGSAALLVATSALVLPMTVFGASGPEAGQVFARLSWGGGEGQVGLVSATEGLTHGPEALAVAADGRVAVLDSGNGRLVLLDADGQALGYVPVDLAQPRFLAVDDEVLYVLDADSDKKLASYSWSGTLTSVVDIPELEDVVTGLFATSQGPCIETGHNQSVLVTGPTVHVATGTQADSDQGSSSLLPGRPLSGQLETVVEASFSPAEGFSVNAASLDEASLRLGEVVELRPTLAQGQEIEHLVSVDTDGDGGLLVGAKLVSAMTSDKVTSALAITRLRSDGPSSDGEGLHIASVPQDEILLLAESDYAYLGDPYFVAPDGRIFQPVADESGYTILVHSFEEVEE